MIEVTKPILPDALEQALAAYKKAGELDPKGSKTKDITFFSDQDNGNFRMVNER